MRDGWLRTDWLSAQIFPELYSGSVACTCPLTDCTRLFLCHHKAGPCVSVFLLSFSFPLLKRPGDWVRSSQETFRHLPDGFWVGCTLFPQWKSPGGGDDSSGFQYLRDLFSPVPQRSVLSLPFRISVQLPSSPLPPSTGQTLWFPSTYCMGPRGLHRLGLLS